MGLDVVHNKPDHSSDKRVGKDPEDMMKKNKQKNDKNMTEETSYIKNHEKEPLLYIPFIKSHFKCVIPRNIQSKIL